MSEPLRVVLADDHVPTRAAVREALEADGFVVVAEVGDADAAVTAALTTSPDVCVLDIHMPGSGIVAAAEVAAALPGTAVVMLTASRHDDDLFASLRAGAVGYLLKDTDPHRLGPALRVVLAGEAVLPRAVVARVVGQLTVPTRARRGLRRRAPGSGLTPREQEILGLMGEGLTTDEIARRLFVAPVTVRTHISALLRKLRVPDREAAVRLVRERGSDGS
ncbi:response regulator transcription factor [Actinotalea sp. AC32]|nr:response regulator transcription factor [Actinotalea sp. AC32]